MQKMAGKTATPSQHEFRRINCGMGSFIITDWIPGGGNACTNLYVTVDLRDGVYRVRYPTTVSGKLEFPVLESTGSERIAEDEAVKYLRQLIKEYNAG